MRASVAWCFLVVVGCSGTADALRARFARERGCPEAQVRVEDEGGNQFRASGCEQRAVYVCGSTGGFGDPGRSCEEQGVTRRGPPDTGGPRQPPIDPRIQESR